MKINEASVIDNKVIDELIAECLHPEVYEALLHIKLQLKPLEPIVWDALSLGNIPYNEVDKYIDQTDI
jgi:hypothetical protein